MKKTTFILIGSLLFILSMNMNAYNGVETNSLFHKKQPFIIKPLSSDSDDGIKGKIMITAGAGLNLFANYLEARYVLSNYYGFTSNSTGHQGTPMFNVAIDYGLGKRVSVGGAFGYQTAKITFHDVYTYGDKYYDTWTRIHIAVRGDYYIVAKDDISLYTGAKFGYNMYTLTTTLPVANTPNYVNNLDVYPSEISAQAHFGLSYYANALIGFNVEVGLGWGGPYLCAAGLAIKI